MAKRHRKANFDAVYAYYCYYAYCYYA